jgi:hypothetical protein
MSQITPAEDDVRAGANNLLFCVLVHLVQEIREAGFNEALNDMPIPVQSALSKAMFGAIAELKTHVPDTYALEWEQESRTLAIFKVFGEGNLSAALKEIEGLKSTPEGGEFGLCGMYAARSLMEAISSGVDQGTWLESYEGMFASMGRLFGAIPSKE